MIDSILQHSIGQSTKSNALRLSCNSIQGHYHAVFEISYAADPRNLRWSMTVGSLMDIDSPAARYAEGLILKRPTLGCGVLLGEAGNTLIISDLHLPYQHKDAFDFLYAVKKRYRTKTILCVGDLIDHHTGSYHETEPDAYSPEEEYYRAKNFLHGLQDIFPRMIIADGNHDAIPKRKMRSIGLPIEMVSDYNKLYDLSPGWLWAKRYEFNCLGAKPLLVPMQLRKNSRWDRSLV